MLSHGVVSAALFLVVGVVYDRIHSREIAAYGGLVNRMPVYALVFMLFMLASVGLPGTGGFVGEVLVLFGAFQANTWVAALAATGVAGRRLYALSLSPGNFRQARKERLDENPDVSPREVAVFAPLIVLVFGWEFIRSVSWMSCMFRLKIFCCMWIRPWRRRA